MAGWFISATGTDIGKSYVAAGLVRQARGPVSAIKPVVSGFYPKDTALSDPALLLQAMGRDVTLAAIEKISPWRFLAPLSPDMAARREGEAIEFKALVRFCRDALGNAAGPCLIEGVGGVMVPLDRHHTVLDWMAALDLPVILVAGTYLGTISHILTAVACLGQRRLKVAALILNQSPAPAVRGEDLIETLSGFLPDMPIVPIARGAEDFGAVLKVLGIFFDAAEEPPP